MSENKNTCAINTSLSEKEIVDTLIERAEAFFGNGFKISYAHKVALHNSFEYFINKPSEDNLKTAIKKAYIEGAKTTMPDNNADAIMDVYANPEICLEHFSGVMKAKITAVASREIYSEIEATTIKFNEFFEQSNADAGGLLSGNKAILSSYFSRGVHDRVYKTAEVANIHNFEYGVIEACIDLAGSAYSFEAECEVA
jgi:uncharacterized protein (DUF927 family)